MDGVVERIDIPRGVLFIGNTRAIRWPMRNPDNTPLSFGGITLELAVSTKEESEAADVVILLSTDNGRITLADSGVDPDVTSDVIVTTFETEDSWDVDDGALFQPGRMYYTLRRVNPDIVIRYGEIWFGAAQARG